MSECTRHVMGDTSTAAPPLHNEISPLCPFTWLSLVPHSFSSAHVLRALHSLFQTHVLECVHLVLSPNDRHVKYSVSCFKVFKTTFSCNVTLEAG
jgi:hypothetical protein